MRAFVSALLLLVTPVASFAASDTRDWPVEDRPQVTLDPSMGYVYLRAPNQLYLSFIRVPTDAEIDDYRTRRENRFQEAYRRYQRSVRTYENAIRAWRQMARGDPRRGPQPNAPLEPTRETIAFPAIETENITTIGMLYRFSKSENLSTYLHALTPGRYIFYGPVSVGVNGAVVGTCYCMGTVSFEVAAGVVTDLGYHAAFRADNMNNLAATSTGLLPSDLMPPAASATIDPRLANYTVRPVQYRAAGKLPNFYRLTIDRLGPMAGVLSYQRDRIIDVVTGEEIPSAAVPLERVIVRPPA